MRVIGPRRAVVGLVLAGALLFPIRPAHAVHLFPLTPDFDPLGHNCAQNLIDPPEPAFASVAVVGFNFIDEESLTPTTTIEAGETVAWEWLADHCHSVTFSLSPNVGTFGAPGFQPAEPQLVRWGTTGRTFSLTFPDPGIYGYFCVHHQSVGMRGSIIVTP